MRGPVHEGGILAVVVAFTLAAAAPHSASAAPARPGIVEVTQPDGSVVELRPWGDEWRNGVETLDGYTAVRDASGRWVHATLDDSGALAPTDAPADGPAPAHVAPHLRAASGVPAAARRYPASLAAPPAAEGTHRTLVLLVDFTPSTSQGTTAQQWREHVFTGGTASLHSVRDYWLAASHGRIRLEPAAETEGVVNDGIVAVTVSRGHPDTGSDTDIRNQVLTRDALIAANSFVNFAAFDADHDGSLTTDELHVILVVRGTEAATDPAGECGASVWGHRWCLTSLQSPTLDGVEVSDCGAGPFGGPGGGYIQIGELHCLDGMATIGITAHELGHDLGGGLPDLYDTDTGAGTDSEGVGAWSLMGSGTWNRLAGQGRRAGTLPALPDAWSRSFLGCLEPQEITAPQGITLPAIDSAPSPSRGVIRTGANPGGVEVGGFGEYFLLENRQRVGFDAGLPGSGLLIWHVDESQSSNADEGANAASDRRLVALEQADGRFDLEGYGLTRNDGDANDPWSQATATRFADDTTPNSRLHGNVPSGLVVRHVSASGPIMAATLGDSPEPEGLAADVGDAIEPQGGTADIPIVLSSSADSSLAGLQVELVLSSDRVTEFPAACAAVRGPAAPASALALCNNAAPGIVRAAIVSASGTLGDGLLMTLRVQTAAGAPVGLHQVAVAECIATDSLSRLVAISCSGGTLAIEESCLPGDVDDSTGRSVRDLVLLRRHLRLGMPLGRPECADADCSGDVGETDAEAARRCVLGTGCSAPDSPGCS